MKFLATLALLYLAVYWLASIAKLIGGVANVAP